MPIRYKVVKRNSRTSAVINGNSPYVLRYIPGTTITARKETLGIMVFATKFRAQEFAGNLNLSYWRDRFSVIKVEAIGRGKYPSEICKSWNTAQLRSFYSDDLIDSDLFFNSTHPPEGTMCYSSVMVLE